MAGFGSDGASAGSGILVATLTRGSSAQSDMADEPEILNAQEAAEFLRVPLLTVQRQAKAGRLPGRRIGKQWRFSRTVLLEWIAAGPDHHDIELFNRRTDREEEGGEDGAGDEEAETE